MSCQRSTISDHIGQRGQGSLTDYAFVALGANLPSDYGDPAATVQAAIVRLAAFAESEVLCSSLWRSAPLDCPPGSPDFVNAVAAFIPRSELSVHALLDGLQGLEQAFGRAEQGNRVTNAPRPLDLDIIEFCGQQVNDSRLQLPHPRASLRLFVMAPLAQLAPELKLAGCDRSVSVIASTIPVSGRFTRLE